MLQQREIAKVLSQVFHGSGILLQKGAFSASLLSSKGLPLITVTAADLPTSEYLASPDTLRVYSLLAINSYRQQEKCGDSSLDEWAVLSLDETLRVIVKRFLTGNKKDPHKELFVILFYTSPFSDIRAKASVDALSDVLAEGLKGYVSG